MKIFNRIDHSAGAKSVGQTLRPTELIIFGNPKVGSKLMQCAQTIAIDLPQKMLIWEDKNGVTWVGYNRLPYLVKRHKLKDCEAVIKKVNQALKVFAKKAASQ